MLHRIWSMFHGRKPVSRKAEQFFKPSVNVLEDRTVPSVTLDQGMIGFNPSTNAWTSSVYNGTGYDTSTLANWSAPSTVSTVLTANNFFGGGVSVLMGFDAANTWNGTWYTGQTYTGGYVTNWNPNMQYSHLMT